MTRLLLLAALLLTASAAPPDDFAGVWHGEDDSHLVLRVDGNLLEARGLDTGSAFEATYFVEGETATGHGTGYNHVDRQRFLYWSTLTLLADGTLHESWRVRFASGEERTGEVTFSRR